MPDTLVGALLGVVAALLGTWGAYLLTEGRDKRRKADELRQALHLVHIELASQLNALTADGGEARIDRGAYEALKARALLSLVPRDIATQIVHTYLLLVRVNEAIQDRDDAFFASIAGGHPNVNLSNFVSSMAATRAAALAPATKC